MTYLRDEPRAETPANGTARRGSARTPLDSSTAYTPTPQRQVRRGAAGNHTALASRRLTTMSNTEVAPAMIAEVETSAAESRRACSSQLGCRSGAELGGDDEIRNEKLPVTFCRVRRARRATWGTAKIRPKKALGR